MARKWTTEELKILKVNYSENLLSNIFELLKKGRTKHAIRNKAFKLGISKNNEWKLKEVVFLRRNYKKMKVSKIAKELGRSKSSIYTKANELNFKKRIKLNLPPSAYLPSKKLAWLIGYLLGDGYLTTGWTIGMKTKDNDLKKFYMKKFREWSEFNKNKFLVGWERGQYKDWKKDKIYPCRKKWVVRVCSKEAWQFFKKFQDNPFYSLRFFPEEHWKFILKGLWDAEGNITPYKSDNRIVIGLSNSNKEILKFYKKICSSLGFHPRLTKRNGEETINIYSLAEILDFVDKIGITVARKRKKVIDRINELRKKREVYHKVIRLRKEGLKRKQILEKLSGSLSPGTFDGWIYSDTKPYYIENAKAR